MERGKTPAAGCDDDPGPDYWDYNDYLALRDVFAGSAALARFEDARGDPESWKRYEQDRERFKELHARFGKT